MLAFFKRLFCPHGAWIFVRNIYGDEIIYRGWKRSIFKCPTCGAYQFRDKLYQAA